LPTAPELATAPEGLHERFDAIVADIDTAYNALPVAQQEQLAARPAGRKVGGDESNAQTW
jgi:hypothetical protein